MGKIFTKEKIKQIDELKREGYTLTEIAKQTGVNLSYLQTYVTARKQGLSPYEYHKRLLERRGFTSQNEYQNVKAKERGFKNDYEACNEHLAKQESGGANIRPFTRYKQRWAEKQGYKSTAEYDKKRQEKNKQRPANQELSDKINKALREKNRTMAWLAQECHVSRESASRYMYGEVIPRQNILQRLLEVLEINPESLEYVIVTE